MLVTPNIIGGFVPTVLQSSILMEKENEMVKKQWVHKYRKEHPEERDLQEKFLLIEILRTEFDRYGLTGEVCELNGRIRFPDVLVKACSPQEAFELDGEYHGWGESTSDKDYKRNEHYAKMGIKLYIINKVATEGYKPELIKMVLREQGLK
jgi:hypothetical protein